MRLTASSLAQTDLWGGSVFLGTEVTNNEAEHEGLPLGLQAAVRHFIRATLQVGGGTKRAINQIAGEWDVRAASL